MQFHYSDDVKPDATFARIIDGLRQQQKEAADKFNRIERLVGKLMFLERDFGRRLSEFSHAAANADRVRLACGSEAAVKRADRAEGEAVAELVEAIETPTPSEWESTVAELAKLGVVRNWNMLYTAKHLWHAIQEYRGTKHLTHAVHQPRLDMVKADLRAAGIEV